ncbi:hypothetical protein GCM10018987_10200 [Streptomyces cremeus]
MKRGRGSKVGTVSPPGSTTKPPAGAGGSCRRCSLVVGRGLAALGLAPGEEVTEAQLRNLFGERGRHPDTDRIGADRLAAGDSPKKAYRAGRCRKRGRDPFSVRASRSGGARPHGRARGRRVPGRVPPRRSWAPRPVR